MIAESIAGRTAEQILADDSTGVCWGCGGVIKTFGARFVACRACKSSVGGTTASERETVFAAMDRPASYRALIARKRGRASAPKAIHPIPDAPAAYAMATADGEVMAWAVSPTPALLVLTGPTGTGKTWQAWGAIRALGRPHQLAKAGTLSRLDRDDLRALACAGVLLIDDLAARTTPGALASALELIDLRLESSALTIVTTNATFAALSELEPRLSSRLASGRVVKLAGKDRRLAKGQA